MGSFVSLLAALALALPSAPETKRVKGEPAYRFRDRFITNKDRSGVAQIDLSEFFKTNEYNPRWMVLNFTASWCVPCRTELEDFAKHADKLKATNLLLVVIVVDDTKEGRQKMLRFANDELKLPFPVLADENHIVSAGYGVGDLPLTVLIDPSGNYAWESKGATSATQVLAKIEEFQGSR
jgi:peroxiredoxin